MVLENKFAPSFFLPFYSYIFLPVHNGFYLSLHKAMHDGMARPSVFPIWILLLSFLTLDKLPQSTWAAVWTSTFYQHWCIFVYTLTGTCLDTSLRNRDSKNMHLYGVVVSALISGERWSRGLSIEGTVVQSHPLPFRNFFKGNFVLPIFACVFPESEETLKAGGPFYLVSMPREVKDPTQGVNL